MNNKEYTLNLLFYILPSYELQILKIIVNNHTEFFKTKHKIK